MHKVCCWEGRFVTTPSERLTLVFLVHFNVPQTRYFYSTMVSQICIYKYDQGHGLLYEIRDFLPIWFRTLSINISIRGNEVLTNIYNMKYKMVSTLQECKTHESIF